MHESGEDYIETIYLLKKRNLWNIASTVNDCETVVSIMFG